jgi:hypothetical protein
MRLGKQKASRQFGMCRKKRLGHIFACEIKRKSWISIDITLRDCKLLNINNPMISGYRCKSLLGTVSIGPTIPPFFIAVPLMTIFPPFHQLCIKDWAAPFIQAGTVELSNQRSSVLGHAASKGGD